MYATIELAGVETSLIGIMSSESILKEYIEMVEESYDYVIIDCSPNLGQLTLNALVAADDVIIPVQAAFLPIKGLEQLLKTISRVKRKLNQKLNILGILLTELIHPLLNMVDEKRLAVSVGVELSFMNKNVQQWIYEFIRENGMIKQEQLMELRKYRDDSNMTQDQLINILIGSASTTPVSKKITLNERKLHKFFPAYYSKTEMERVIFGLLEQWKQAQESEEK